jgi:hypothetical protein
MDFPFTARQDMSRETSQARGVGMNMNSVLTGLFVQSIDNFQPKVWDKLRLPRTQLAAIRAGTAVFSDSQLKQVSAAAGEPWWRLVFRLDKNNSKFTQATRDVCQELESLRNSAARGVRYKSKSATLPKAKPRRTKSAASVH